ncbi:unnamed protein product [Pneumocystis jirovecii]|uniref:Ribosomal protein L17 n=2 Tax=Pneumocystis jirovecii TaxID=42068 RepID=L0P724_PNEJI|nr:ribosomal protein L17 [Pneumocystis jirovecii RU7]KTW32224.1 ribosomal protein L17 [Pneumocystis jirovecii RU7]CCJ28216.1 unnamed protein product [Pneumocystis jirovecii]
MPIKPRWRKFNRLPSHRQSLLRNIVSSLIIYESIQTTFSKAKESQKIADKLITYAKKGLYNQSAYKHVQSIKPKITIPKLYGILKKRFSERHGGYTRVLKLPSRKSDSAPMAVLEYVDGPKDIRFLMSAKTIAYSKDSNLEKSKITIKNIQKTTRFQKEKLAILKNTSIEFRNFLVKKH